MPRRLPAPLCHSKAITALGPYPSADSGLVSEMESHTGRWLPRLASRLKHLGSALSAAATSVLGSRHRLPIRFARHLKAAVFIASAVLLVDRSGLLERPTVEALRWSWGVSETLFGRDRLATASDSGVDGGSRVFTITDLLYEQTYGQRSPLDRDALHRLFKDILCKDHGPPSVLAIDLDLSPGPAGTTESETRLYDFLKAPDCGDDLPRQGTEMVLITPMKVRDKDLVRTKHEWMCEMCVADHIRFGLPYIYNVGGAVLKLREDPRLFPRQVHAAACRRGTWDCRPETPPSDCTDIGSICDVCAAGDYRYVNARADDDLCRRFSPLSFKAFEAVEPVPLRSEQLGPDLDHLASRVVFVGGSYGVTDKYQTPVGTLAGVHLHAASAFSLAVPVRNFNHAVSYILEILASTLFGAAAYVLARKYRTTGSLPWLGANILIPSMLAVIYFIAAGWLLTFNVWLNPAPLVIGMEIHAWLEAANEPHSEAQDAGERRAVRNSEPTWIRHGLFWMVPAGAWLVLALHLFGSH